MNLIGRIRAGAGNDGKAAQVGGLSGYISRIKRRRLSLGDLAALDAVGADANALRCAIDQRVNGLQIRAPSPTSYVVGVGNVIAKLRAFAANVAYLCHDSTPKS